MWLLILVFFCSFYPANLSMAPASSSGPPSLRKDSTPVIANVVSLASTPAAQPTVNSNNVLQGRTTECDFSIFKSLFLDVYSCSGIFSTEDNSHFFIMLHIDTEGCGFVLPFPMYN